MKLAPAPEAVITNCPLLVFEEIDSAFHDKLKVGSLSIEGLAHPDRVPFVLKWHIIEPAQKQIYATMRADKTPHCSLLPSDLPMLKQKISSLGRDPVADVIFYPNTVSHTADSGFMRIWNGGTPEFDIVRPIFDHLSFSRVHDHCLTLQRSNRGNKHVALGISSQNLAQRSAITSVSIPEVNKGTTLFSDEFVKMSALAVHLGVSKGTSITRNNPADVFRFLSFPTSIDPSNIFEGLTLAENDPESAVLALHCNIHNSTDIGYDELLVALCLLLDKSCIPPKVVHPVEIAYQRRSCQNYLTRVEHAWPLIRHVGKWFHSLPLHRRGFSPDIFFQKVGDVGILNGTALISRANADKCVWYSPFGDAFLNLHAKFNLSIHEALEILYPIAWLVEPFKYYTILNDWMAQGWLPSGCLVLAFGEECYRRFGGLSGGLFQRSAPYANKPIAYNRIFSSLQGLAKIVSKYNRLGKVKHDTFTNLFQDLKEHVDGAGPLSCQQLMHVLVLTGILHHPSLATMAVFAAGTHTCHKVMSLTGCSNSDVDIILRSVAHHLRSTSSVAENSTCESSRGSEKFDFYFKGQSILIAERSNLSDTNKSINHDINRYFPDGTMLRVPYFGSMASRQGRKWQHSSTWWVTGTPLPAGHLLRSGGTASVLLQKRFFRSEEQANLIRNQFLISSEIQNDLPQVLWDKLPSTRKTGHDNQRVKINGEMKEPIGWDNLIQRILEEQYAGVDARYFRVITGQEVVKKYDEDPVSKMVQKLTMGNEPVTTLAIDNFHHRRRPPGGRGKEDNSLQEKARKRQKGISVITDLPKTIKFVRLEWLVTGLGFSWSSLDFYGAASICAGVHQLLDGEPLRRNNLKVHKVDVRLSSRPGYYCTFLKFDYSQQPNVMAIGQGVLGWYPDKEGTYRLLCQTKQQAIDHFLLCMVLFEQNGGNWRSTWARRKFSSSADVSLIPVTKSDAKAKERQTPFFTLVKSTKSTSSLLEVYAVFVHFNANTHQQSMVAFPFNF